MLTVPVADMLTRIRNANKALHDRAEMPNSKLKTEIARILKEEGYIRDYHVAESEGKPHKTLVIELKYGRRRQRVLGGMGIAIMSTSHGVVTSRTAEQQGIGGEVICFVW